MALILTCFADDMDGIARRCRVVRDLARITHPRHGPWRSDYVPTVLVGHHWANPDLVNVFCLHQPPSGLLVLLPGLADQYRSIVRATEMEALRGLDLRIMPDAQGGGA